MNNPLNGASAPAQPQAILRLKGGANLIMLRCLRLAGSDTIVLQTDDEVLQLRLPDDSNFNWMDHGDVIAVGLTLVKAHIEGGGSPTAEERRPSGLILPKY